MEGGWMNGWIDGLIDKDGRMDDHVGVDGWKVDGWTDGLIEIWMDGWMVM